MRNSRGWESRMFEDKVWKKRTMNRIRQSFQQFLSQQMHILQGLLLWGNEKLCPSQSSPQFMLTASQHVQPAAQQILLMFPHSSVVPCSMKFGLYPWASRGRAHFHRFNSFISNGNYRAFVITLAPVPSPLFILWSVVVVFKMFVKTEAH